MGEMHLPHRLSNLAAIAIILAARPALAESEDLERVIRRLFEESAVPGIRIRKLEIAGDHAVIGLELPDAVRLDSLPEEIENRFEEAAGALAALRPDATRIDLLVAHPGGPLMPPPVAPPVSPDPGPSPSPSAGVPDPPSLPKGAIFNVATDPARFPFGQALRGKTIAISPGHGYIYYDAQMGYSTQRGRVRWEGCGDCRGIVEDFETHEIVVNQLIPLLEGAGARVVMVREPSHSAEGAIADQRSAGYRELSGSFSDAADPGAIGGAHRVSSDPDASASFSIAAPGSGPQLLSLWFVAGTDRLERTALDVIGPFGTQLFSVNQRDHGRRWVPIALYDLDPGDSVEVRLRAPNDGSTGLLVANAVRFGAGEHTTHHPWWQMGALPFARYQNAPPQVPATNDVTVRPQYASWFGADAYISLHSNASGSPRSTAGGISSYRFNCLRYPDHTTAPPAAACDFPIGSARLQTLIHDAMVERIRQDFDRGFLNRGPKVANFGELRELNGIPGVLIESAFHDQVLLPGSSTARVTDNEALHDPRWRRAAAYGIYKGVSEFLVGSGPLLLSPPDRLVARRVDPTRVSVDFRPTGGALGYRVYVARDSRVFDQGTIADAPPVTIEDLTPGVPVFVKVAALNEAGEGVPSAIVAARPSDRPAQLLLVNAFLREDAHVTDIDNRHDTLMTHGLALKDAAAAFDGADLAAVMNGTIALDGYDGLILAFGRESVSNQVFSPALRARIRTLVDNGGAVFASGSEIGWVLDARGDADSRAFLESTFGAAFVRDDAGALRIRSAPGGWLIDAAAGSGLLLDDGTGGGLEARSSDVLRVATGGTIELYYGSGMDVAAVRRDRNLVLGVSIDSVVGNPARAALLRAWIDRAITLADPEPGPRPPGGRMTPPDPTRPGGMTGPDPARHDPATARGGDPGSTPSPEPPSAEPGTAPRKTRGCACTGHPGPATRAAFAAPAILTLGLVLEVRRRRRGSQPSR